MNQKEKNMFWKTSESMEYISFVSSITGIKRSNTEKGVDDTSVREDSVFHKFMMYCKHCSIFPYVLLKDKICLTFQCQVTRDWHEVSRFF